MFYELRTTRSGWTPVEVCASSRQFRWHSRHDRSKFGFAATLQEEFQGVPIPIGPTFSHENKLPPQED